MTLCSTCTPPLPGQTDDQLRDLAYLLFAAVAVGTCSPQHCALLPVMRQQLGVEESRAADVARVLKHIQPCRGVMGCKLAGWLRGCLQGRLVHEVVVCERFIITVNC